MTTSTLPRARLADAACSARTGADLYRFGMGDRIPDAAFAKNGDGTITISGVDLLKAGTFNGLSLLDDDLEAMAARFVQLRDAGVFLPPFRLDHSWSVLSVIGWFDNVETYRRVDQTDSMEKTFLRGDIRLTGSVDYTPDQIVKAIKLGSLTKRSSELGYYVTNSGVELPLVFYGCAFVDIPAVEGLAAVELSKVRLSTPHSIVSLNAEGSSMDPVKLARLVALRTASVTAALDEADAAEFAALSAEAESAGLDPETVTSPAPEASPDAEGVEESADDTNDPSATDPTNSGGDPDEDPDDEDEGTGDEGGDEDEGDNPPPVEAPPAGDDVEDESRAAAAAELSRLRAENTRLRNEAADRRLAEFRTAGVVTQANEEAAIALLRHDDEEVRRRTGVLLAGVPARVELSKRRGRTNLTAAGNGSGVDGVLIQVGMSKDEVGPLWAALSTEERAERQSEYDAWRAARDETGDRS